MRPDGIVVLSPALNQHLRFMKCREQLPRQQLITELRVEALTITVLPWRAWCDEERFHTDPAEPMPHTLGNELGTIVGTNVLGRAVRDEQIRQAVQHVIGSQAPGNNDGKAAACELVDHSQHAKGSPVLGTVLHEVVGPDVIGPLWAQANA